MYCWGTGNAGQLGVIGAVRARTPIAVIGSYTAVQVSSGTSFWCEVLQSTKVSCTGLNDAGQLGNGTTSPAQYPQDVAGLPAATRVEAGVATTCALTAEGVFCWGEGGRGQLGDGELQSEPVTTPKKVEGLGAVSDLAVGKEHACVVRSDQRVLCWGGTLDGKLGTPLKSPISLPREPVAGLTGAVQVTAGTRHSCALTTARTVWCWGSGEVGQLGNGRNDTTSEPVQVQGLADVAQVNGNAETTCAVRGDGTVWCWGNGERGELGNGTRGKSNVPVQVQGVAQATSATVGATHVCATTRSLAAYCWGSNSAAQLGSGGVIGAAGIEASGQLVQDAIRGTAQFLPTPLAERGTTTRGGRVYLRVLHLTRRGSKCPRSAAVTIRARGRSVVRTARDIELAEGDCTVTGRFDLPTQTRRAFRVVVVVRGKHLKTRKVNLRVRVGQT